MHKHFGGMTVGVGILALLVAIDAGARGRLPFSLQASPLRPRPAPTLAWTERLALVDEALATRDVRRAVHEWRDAYGAALRSRSWRALLAVGDHAVRIDGLLAEPGPFREEARRAYLAALFRARSEDSAEGVHGAADAFERLGDGEVAVQARRILGRAP